MIRRVVCLVLFIATMAVLKPVIHAIYDSAGLIGIGVWVAVMIGLSFMVDRAPRSELE
jgi:hypothetical protein